MDASCPPSVWGFNESSDEEIGSKSSGIICDISGEEDDEFRMQSTTAPCGKYYDP